MLFETNEKTIGTLRMKFKLIIDKNVEEEIIAIVHEPSLLIKQIENLVWTQR